MSVWFVFSVIFALTPRIRYIIDKRYHTIFCHPTSWSCWARGSLGVHDDVSYFSLTLLLLLNQGKGVCFRLYTEQAFKSMDPSSEPEICRCSLTASFLQLKCLGQNLDELEFLDQPQPDAGKLRLLRTRSDWLLKPLH